MTVVEFFTNSPLENMISCFSLKPSKVIFVGEGRRMRRLVSAYKDVAKRIGIDSDFEIRTAPNNNINAIKKVLIDIVESEEECCFDLTGGADLALVAMGIVFQSYKGIKKLQMQRFNIKTGRMIDCDSDEEKSAIYAGVALSAKEYIALYGGKITESVRYTPDRDEDLNELWSVCRTKPVAWNKVIGLLGQVASVSHYKESGARAVLDKKRCFNLLGNTFKFDEIRNFIALLSQKNLVRDIKETEDEYSFTYCNPTVKKCLAKAGDILELTVLSAASRLTGSDGTPYFNDSLSGVVIDWDGVSSADHSVNGSVNEIDVMLMRGVIPTFISCKNGGVDESELYKLATVAERFGGSYSKKVLIISSFNKKGYAKEYFFQRANDMGIRVIDNARRLSEKELSDILKNL